MTSNLNSPAGLCIAATLVESRRAHSSSSSPRLMRMMALQPFLGQWSVSRELPCRRRRCRRGASKNRFSKPILSGFAACAALCFELREAASSSALPERTQVISDGGYWLGRCFRPSHTAQLPTETPLLISNNNCPILVAGPLSLF